MYSEAAIPYSYTLIEFCWQEKQLIEKKTVINNYDFKPIQKIIAC